LVVIIPQDRKMLGVSDIDKLNGSGVLSGLTCLEDRVHHN